MAEFRRSLTLLDITMIAIDGSIGSGIFMTPATIAAGGVFFAEVADIHPRFGTSASSNIAGSLRSAAPGTARIPGSARVR